MSESENILRRLKEQTPYTNVLDGELMKDAATEIERLRAENEKLRADKAAWQGVQQGTVDVVKQLEAENEKLRREAIINIDRIQQEQDTVLDIIADYNEAVAEIEKLRAALKPITDIKAFTCIFEWTPVEALRDDEKVHVKLTGAQIKAMRAAAALKETGDDNNDA